MSQAPARSAGAPLLERSRASTRRIPVARSGSLPRADRRADAGRPRARRAEVRPFTPDEARAFLVAVQGDRLQALYTVALALGLRQGEALGLRWPDVDLA